MGIIILSCLVLVIVFSSKAQVFNPYHHIIKRVVKYNFRCISEHRYEEVLKGVSDRSLVHTFAGDKSLGGTTHDKESLKRWFERV